MTPRMNSSGSWSRIPAPSPVFGIRARGAAVLEVLERDDGAVYGLVRRLAIELGNHGDAAGVVLVGRVVEADRATVDVQA